jgi:hypothetical protein
MSAAFTLVPTLHDAVSESRGAVTELDVCDGLLLVEAASVRHSIDSVVVDRYSSLLGQCVLDLPREFARKLEEAFSNRCCSVREELDLHVS